MAAEIWFIMAALLAPAPPADILFLFPKTELTEQACWATAKQIHADWMLAGKTGRVSCQTKPAAPDRSE